MNQPGVYLLLIRLSRRAAWTVAGTERTFHAGYYLYTGSARNGLAGRLARHLRTSHAVHWHVDELLARGTVLDIQTRFANSATAECELAREATEQSGGEEIPGFGASDCSCRSHLVFCPQRPGFSVHEQRVLPHLDAMFAAMTERYEDHLAVKRDPFRTLVFCMLSLRTRDPVTHAATERLFAELRTPQAFAKSDRARIAELIYPVGMYRQKSLRLKEMSHLLLEEYDGEVPAEIERLLALPGVGRKTANLVRSFAFHLPAVCVDTHVHRITNRWGLVRTATPDETERALRSILPDRFWQPINGYLVQHGQQTCRPQRPDCARCPLRPGCAYEELLRERELLDAVDGAPAHPSLTLRK